MKTLIFLLAFAGILSNASGQVMATMDVPPTVQKAFTKMNPKATSADWQRNGYLYTANYTEDNLSRSVTYDAAGKFREKEMQISIGQLPTSALKYINDNHSDGVIKKAYKVTKMGGKTSYLVYVKDLELAFNADGKYQEPMK